MLKSWSSYYGTCCGTHLVVVIGTSVFLVSHCRVLRVYSSFLFLLVVLRIVYTELLFNPHYFPFYYVA
jgi:hypothetical protein